MSPDIIDELAQMDNASLQCWLGILFKTTHWIIAVWIAVASRSRMILRLSDTYAGNTPARLHVSCFVICQWSCIGKFCHRNANHTRVCVYLPHSSSLCRRGCPAACITAVCRFTLIFGYAYFDANWGALKSYAKEESKMSILIKISITCMIDEMRLCVNCAEDYRMNMQEF